MRENFALGSNPEGSVNDALHAINKQIYDLLRRADKAKGTKLKDLKKEVSVLVAEKERLAKDINPYDAYKRHAGEVEARNVQTRMNMSPVERRVNPPWKTQDTPDEQQIVRFDKKGIFSPTGRNQ